MSTPPPDSNESAPASESPRPLEALVNGERLRDWPDDLYIPPDALEVFLETFQGPLDLLLYLIRKQNLDILNIPVAQITRQYMDYVELMRHFRLDLAAEYLVMAAVLAEIKSRMLLPRAPSEEEDEEDPRAALVRRLQEYERYTQAAHEINQLPRVERELYLVSAEFVDPAPTKVLPRASLHDLTAAFRAVLERNERNRHLAVNRETLTMREKMTVILERVRERRMLSFDELFDADEGRLGLVVSFMAILELVRNDMLTVIQNEAFAPIHMRAPDE